MNKEHGFSMVELLVALGILSLVMAGVYSLMIQNEKIYQVQLNLSDMQQNARVSLDLMAREIRMAGADPTYRAFLDPAVNEAIEAAGASSIEVKMDRPYDDEDDGYDISDKNTDNDTEDLNENDFGDGFINDDGEHVEFSWNSSTGVLFRVLKNHDPNIQQPVADNVTGLAFTYFDDDGNEIADPDNNRDDIEKIEIAITVRSRDKDLNTGQYKTFSLSTEVTLRNR